MSRAGDSRARASGRGRRSRRPRNRLGKQDLVGENLEKISPGGHKKQGQGFAHFCKEARARAGDCSRLLPEIFRRFGDSVEGEGEKIKGGEDGGQVFPAMPEIMFEVITFRFQDVEALVLDLPSGAAGGNKLGDGVGIDGQIGDERIAIGNFARGVGNSISSQLTVMASSPSRSGTPSIQR
jgi:hypothetical protein